jgi:hypothetical protein
MKIPDAGNTSWSPQKRPLRTRLKVRKNTVCTRKKPIVNNDDMLTAISCSKYGNLRKQYVIKHQKFLIHIKNHDNHDMKYDELHQSICHAKI